MCDDVVAVVKEMYGDSPPAIVLVGHRLSSFHLMFLYFIVLLVSGNRLRMEVFFLGGWGMTMFTYIGYIDEVTI